VALAEPQAVLDGYLAGDGPKMQQVPGDRAYCRADGSDTIVMPLQTEFRSPPHYCAANLAKPLTPLAEHVTCPMTCAGHRDWCVSSRRPITRFRTATLYSLTDRPPT